MRSLTLVLVLSGLLALPAVGWAEDTSKTTTSPSSASDVTVPEQSPNDAAIRAAAERITAEHVRQVGAASSDPVPPVADPQAAYQDLLAPPPVKPEKGWPLPLHTIEGVGGVGLTEMAYLVNPSVGNDWLGLPSLSFTHVQTGHQNAEIGSISETLFKRLELSFSNDYVGLGDFDLAVKNKLGVSLGTDYVQFYNAGARLALVNEGDYGQSWLPAVTAGVHYKYNATINEFNNELGGALNKVVGVKDYQGVDYTLTATKMFKDVLPRPFFVSGTVRNTDSVDTGWLGFTNERRTVFEGNVGVFVRPDFVLAAECREMPNDIKLKQLPPGVLGVPSDWWTLAAAYVIDRHWTVSAAYANLGNVLNHKEPASLWLQVKYEF